MAMPSALNSGGGAGPSSRNAIVNNRDIFTIAGKRSITIAGHPTSIRIEPLFWEALCAESLRFGIPVNALVAEIDAARLGVDNPPNLASAIRLWLFSTRPS